jgi:hypothetical protein
VSRARCSRERKGEGPTAVVGERCILEDQNESNVPYLEPQARQHENSHRAEGWSASSPGTDLKDGRFYSIALGLFREEGQWVGSFPSSLAALANE